jgi:MraZ protein
MRAMFRGMTQLALDAKGRLAIPSRHREALAPRIAADGPPEPMVLTVDASRCLLLYPRAEWEPIQARLMAFSSFNSSLRALQRLMVGYADEVEMDGAGRILVPLSLREFAGLEHHVAFVGQGNRFELWDHARWQAATAEAITFPAGPLPPELEGFSL